MTAQIIEHNRKAAAMWGSGGRAYDEISRSIAGAIEHCVTRLYPVRGERIADIATGTGWTARAVAQFGAEVVGIDIAEGMLDAARDIAREQGLSIDYRLGDAEAFPFSDAAFDAVISTFGVMFAPDQQRAATELARVIRPRGRVAIAAWTPDSNAVKLRQVLQPFMTPAPTVLTSPPPSPFLWGTHGWTRDAFGDKFRVASEGGTVISRFRSAEAAWKTYAAGFGPVRAVAAGLQGDALGAMQRAVVDWTAQFSTDLGIAIPFDYLVTIANRD
jgi:ubiquinone/menaquinone biosynthesis C-methylase UbiE